jgi:threonine efflux protein
MDIYLSIFSIVGALLIGAISPGPSFILIVQTSAATSRKNGISMALGLGMGSTLFGLCALLGLQLVFQTVEIVYWTFKILGSTYLFYLSYKIYTGSKQKLVIEKTAKQQIPPYYRSFLLGLLTQLSNPKTAIVFASVFASFLTNSLNITEAIILLSLIFISESIWYIIVAYSFSTDNNRKTYLRMKTSIDRCAAGIIAFMGLKLLFSKN